MIKKLNDKEEFIGKCPLRFNLKNQDCIKSKCRWYMYLGTQCNIEECAIETIAKELFEKRH